jgi:hypothetical protein
MNLKNKINMKTYRFYGRYLPFTFDYKYFGSLISQKDNVYIVLKHRTTMGVYYEFHYSENKVEVFVKAEGVWYIDNIDFLYTKIVKVLGGKYKVFHLFVTHVSSLFTPATYFGVFKIK